MQSGEVKTVAVLGTGNMGPGVAVLFARAGKNVVVWAHSSAGARKAREDCARDVNDLVGHGVMREDRAVTVLRKISVTQRLAEAVGQADFVSESVVEDLEVKRTLFAEVMSLSLPHTVIASNTSTLLPSRLQNGLSRAASVLVAHFWNPAQLVPLVEVCAGKQTSREAVKTTMDLLVEAGKKPVLLKKEILGFLGNRLMHAMNREALSLIDRGIVDAEGIDEVVLSSFGPRFANLGPMEYLDFVGLDLIRNIQEYLYADLDATRGSMPLVDRLAQNGNLGLKTGAGLMSWSAKDPEDVRRRRDSELLRRMGEVDRCRPV